MKPLVDLFGRIMQYCYELSNNYGIAIIMFTALTKVMLFPISIWVQSNSIKMVKMQPEVNFIKARHFGDGDTIAREQRALFKREHYNPMSTLIPLVVQILLLMCVIEVIKAVEPGAPSTMRFMGFDLRVVTWEEKGITWLVPLLAGISSWLLCLAQNRINVIQAEQSKYNKYFMMFFSVGLSLFLGCFVSAGVVLYWVASNLLAILVQVFLNGIMDPHKKVDYEALEKSKAELKLVTPVKEPFHFNDPLRKRAGKDYKRLFSLGGKHLLFYSEGSGFYKYYSGFIDYILSNTNIPIHYVTSDPNDQVFEKFADNEQVLTYYISGKRLITMFQRLDVDVVVMTMPDLDNMYLKRSIVKKDAYYIYVQHGFGSINLTMRQGSVDNYDAVFVTDKVQEDEVIETEKVYNLPRKAIIPCGYPLMDEMREMFLADAAKTKGKQHDEHVVLIAPSWQKDNLIDLCGMKLINAVRSEGRRIIVRPHPQHVRHTPELFEQMKRKFENVSDVEIQTDFSSNNTVFESDVVITDWSSIAYEFALSTHKPVLFVNTPMKVMNPEYERIPVQPMDIWIRDVIGKALPVSDVEQAGVVVEELLVNGNRYQTSIEHFINDYVYNPGNSADIGARFIIGEVMRMAGKHIA